MIVRACGAAEVGFMWRMLGYAAGTGQRSEDELRADPAIGRYLDGWGRPGDLGVIACAADRSRLGAAWCRRFTAAEPGYGFIAEDVPEVTIACEPWGRRQGAGQAMLTELLRRAAAEGHRLLSLSVARSNEPAMALYRRAGFVVIDGQDPRSDSVTMSAATLRAPS